MYLVFLAHCKFAVLYRAAGLVGRGVGGSITPQYFLTGIKAFSLKTLDYYVLIPWPPPHFQMILRPCFMFRNNVNPLEI